MPPRLLVVEDDDLQKAVLKSALERRGYEVETASDGLTAILKLRAGDYDLALMDYHLPEVDGFVSAQLLRELMAEEDRPRLIAITAASDDLADREGMRGIFDAIVPKPLELTSLLNIVDSQLRITLNIQTARDAETTWRGYGLATAPAVVALQHPTAVQAHLLRCYFDLSGHREPEALLLIGPNGTDEAVAARAHSSHFALPVVDLTGGYPEADAAFNAANHASWAEVAAAIVQFTTRRASLARNVATSSDLDTRLLAYVFLSGRALEPSADFTRPECVNYRGFFPPGDARLAAERLASRGLLERRFFDRFHVCGSCGSSRLNVREECPACFSPQLRETAVLHHFRCAHQAPEEEFIHGATLICPKCRQQLRHYGSDYDRPGTAITCGGCATVSPLPVVGFACLDCGRRTLGDAATKRDVFSYVLTPDGAALLRRGTARIGEGQFPAIGSLPAALRAELRHSSSVVALAELRYGARERLVARWGQTGFLAMRRLFMENLVNAVGGECVVEASPDVDHLLIRDAPSGVIDELTQALLEDCQELLAEGLEPELRLLGIPNELAVSG
jgi:CheY-like chemotaxis protein